MPDGRAATFVSNVAIDPGELARVAADLAAFLIPHARAASDLTLRSRA